MKLLGYETGQVMHSTDIILYVQSLNQVFVQFPCREWREAISYCTTNLLRNKVHGQ